MTPGTQARRPGQQQGTGTPCASVGDEVFFHKAGVPVSGVVRAAGRHGCTVEHGGAHHKVRWQHVSGHKKRAVQRYHVVEHGEDGLIVRDGSGRHRYVGIPPEARQEQLVLDRPTKPRKPGRAGEG